LNHKIDFFGCTNFTSYSLDALIFPPSLSAENGREPRDWHQVPQRERKKRITS